MIDHLSNTIVAWHTFNAILKKGGLSAQHEIVYLQQEDRAYDLYGQRLYERCRKRIV